MINSQNGVPISTIKLTFFLVALMLLLAMPKIYLSSQIYYSSKIVNDLDQDVAVLKSENEMLKDKIEFLKYKRDIKDMIVTQEEPMVATTDNNNTKEKQ